MSAGVPLSTGDILEIGDQVSPRRDVLSILWAITKACNYACAYCVYYKSARDPDYSTREDLLRAAETIARLGRPGYQITLYGGEPTLHPHFLDLLGYMAASEAPLAMRMYTNGSRSAAFFGDVVRTAGRFPFGVIFSLHEAFANFERFRRNVEIVAEGGLAVGVSLMFDPQHRDTARRQIESMLELRARLPFFASLNLPYTRSGEMGGGCTKEDLAWLHQARAAFAAFPTPGHLGTPYFTRLLSEVLVTQDGAPTRLGPTQSLQLLDRLATPSFEGFYCCSGANMLFIEEDGAVRGGVCSASAPMGNIFRDGALILAQNMNVVRCSAVACNSIENIPLPKFRDPAAARQCLSAFKSRAKTYVYAGERMRLASGTRQAAGD